VYETTVLNITRQFGGLAKDLWAHWLRITALKEVKYQWTLLF